VSQSISFFDNLFLGYTLLGTSTFNHSCLLASNYMLSCPRTPAAGSAAAAPAAQEKKDDMGFSLFD
jgi:hypothetical protein